MPDEILTDEEYPVAIGMYKLARGAAADEHYDKLVAHNTALVARLKELEAELAFARLAVDAMQEISKDKNLFVQFSKAWYGKATTFLDARAKRQTGAL